VSGAFDWGSEKGPSKNANEGAGKAPLPKHIRRLNNPNEVVEVKNSISTKDSGLPWGGQPGEKKKAYMSGYPGNKGSIMGAKGTRKSPVGHAGGTTSPAGKLPHEGHVAHAGHKMHTKSVHIKKPGK
jgi:hypothetical protein